MRILMVITELAPAGAERIVLELTSRLIRKGHTVCVTSLKPPPAPGFTAITDALSACGAQLHFADCGKNPLKLIRFLRKTICDFKPDVIHAHLIHPALLCRFACLFTHIPLVNTIHIAERRKGKGLYFLLDKLTSFRCDHYTAVSHAAAHFHAQKCGFAPGRIQVIANGSDPVGPASPERIAALKKEWGLSDCTRIAGAAGRLDFQKGYDRFLEAVPEIARRLPQGEKLGLVFLGDGPDREKLNVQAEKLNAQYANIRAVFPGYRPDAASCLAMLNLFLMPSRYEGYGLALAEAFSLGLPALSSKADSLPEICAHFPGHFILCDFTSTEDTADCFFRALALNRFEGKTIRTFDEMAEDYLAVYES